LSDQQKESIIVPVHKKGDKTDYNNSLGISLLSTSYKILSNILLSRLDPVGFDITDQLLSDFLHSSDTGERMGVQWDSTSSYS
jgi:hypothetical protein